MINIPVWLLVLLAVHTVFVWLLLIYVIIDIATALVYEKYELEKYKNKEKEND